MKRILLATILAFFMSNAHSATMWCLKETATCTHGTPSLSRLKLDDRKAALYTLTVANYNLVVANGEFVAVTANELIRLAKEYLASQVVIPEPEVCPENTTGTFPDCVPVVIEPETCPEGFEGTPPNCTAIVIPEPEPVNLLDGKVQCGSEFGWCSFGTNDPVTRQVWFGGADALSNPITAEGFGTQCNKNLFPNATLGNKCYILGNPPVVVEPTPVDSEPTPVEPGPEAPPPHQHGDIHDGHHGLPKINPNSYMQPVTGFSDLRVRPTTRTTGNSSTGGDFRITCDAAFMATIDPVVYFGQTNTPHNHTFFGNTVVTPTSTANSLKANGNSTCKGGVGNRSAYWIPTLVDTSTDTAMKPNFALFYYKNGQVKPPNGLVILAGDMTGSPTNQQATGWSPEVIRWVCNDVYAGKQNHIPACTGKLQAMINFPMWWDGVNLDSPDHKSHMAYAQSATHTQRIPDITYNIYWSVPNGTSNLRLSSDNYVGGAGGYSLHADYMFAWDDGVLTKWFNGCTLARRDCHSELLGNGEELY